MANIVISRIQHRRGRRENLPQPLLPAEVALTSDTAQAWIGQDPLLATASVNVYSDQLQSTAQTILDNNIVEVKFNESFNQSIFTTVLVPELTGTPTPAVVLTDLDILWDSTFRGEILGISTITTPGSGFTTGDAITAVSSTGTGFVGTLIASAGAITGVTVTSGGSNYRQNNTTFVLAGGTGGEINLVLNDIHGTSAQIAADPNIDALNTVANVVTAIGNIVNVLVANNLISSAAFSGTFVSNSLLVDNHLEAANLATLINRVNSTTPGQVTGLVFTNLNIEITGGAGAGATTLGALTDVDLTGATDNDLLFRSGGNFIDTQGALTWDGTKLTITGTEFIVEQAAAEIDVAGQGQIWVRNDTPNVLVFTDDAGTDTVLGGGAPSGTDDQTLVFVGTALTASDFFKHDNSDIVTFTNQFSQVFKMDFATSNRLTFGGAGLGSINFGDTTLFQGSIGNAAVYTQNYNGTIQSFETNTAGHTLRLGNTGTPWTRVELMQGTPIRFNESGGVEPMDMNNDGNYVVMNFAAATRGLKLDTSGSLYLDERAAASADEAGFGQLWVRNDTPNTPMFTDDAGTDFELNAAGGGGAVLQQFPWIFSTITTASDPGTNTLRFNNAVPASVTELYIDDTSADAQDIGSLIISKLVVGMEIEVFDPTNYDTLQTYIIIADPVDGTGFWTIAVFPSSVRSGASIPADAAAIQLRITFDPHTPIGVDTSGRGTMQYWNVASWDSTGTALEFDANTAQPRMTMIGTASTLRSNAIMKVDVGNTETSLWFMTGNSTTAGHYGYFDSTGTTEFFTFGHTDFGDHLQFNNFGSIVVLGTSRLFYTEKATDGGAAAGLGQYWVRNDTPNTPMFTDDAGTDFVIGGSTASSALITVADTASTSTFLVMTDNATGDEAPLTDAGLTYNASTAALTTTTFIGTFEGSNANGPTILDEAASATNPTVAPDRTDTDSGVGSAGADAPNIIAGAVEAVRYTEVSSSVLQSVEANVGLTAFATGGQASATIMLSSYNVFSTVATAGDSSKLPATFLVGTLVRVKNDGAASMDVFPATGDDAGAGLNTAVAVAAGTGAIFVGTVANATWTQML